MRRIIFLDFDGVLHGDANARLSRLPLFEQALRQMPKAEVVISSTWREDQSLDELRAYFAPELHRQFVGVTPQLPCGYDPQGRQREVEAWLQGAGLPSSGMHWVAVDDWPHLYDPDCSCLIATDPLQGLMPADIEALLAWYRAQH